MLDRFRDGNGKFSYSGCGALILMICIFLMLIIGGYWDAGPKEISPKAVVITAIVFVVAIVAAIVMKKGK